MWEQRVVQQAGQLDDGPLRVGVFRTLEDPDGAYAVLRILLEGADRAQELTMRPGDVAELEGIGDLVLLGTEPSTRERRGSVRLALESAGDRAGRSSPGDDDE